MTYCWWIDKMAASLRGGGGLKLGDRNTLEIHGVWTDFGRISDGFEDKFQNRFHGFGQIPDWISVKSLQIMIKSTWFQDFSEIHPNYWKILKVLLPPVYAVEVMFSSCLCVCLSVSLSVCLSVCLHVCVCLGYNIWSSWHRNFIFGVVVHLDNI